MIEDLLKTIAKTLNDQYGGRAYYVGGYVRDLILNRPNKDIDIEVHGVEANQLEKTLSLFGTVKHVGKSYGIFLFTAEIDGEKYKVDFSLPCQKVDGKHIYNPYMALNKSLYRRDLTMNAIMMDVLSLEMYDPFNGLKDIESKVLRYVDAQTFKDDPLRVYRVARFAAQLNFTVDPSLIDLCKNIDTTYVAHERVFKETNKVLLSNNPKNFFETLMKMNRLQDYFEEINAQIGITQNVKYHREDVFAHTMLCLSEVKNLNLNCSNLLYFMWAILLHDIGKPYTKEDRMYEHPEIGSEIAVTLLLRITNDKNLINYVRYIVLHHMEFFNILYNNCKKSTILKFMDQKYSTDLLLINYVDLKGRLHKNDIKQRDIAIYKEKVNECKLLYKKFLKETDFINGNDLINLGIPQGKHFSQLLQRAKNLEYRGYKKEFILKDCLCNASITK